MYIYIYTHREICESGILLLIPCQVFELKPGEVKPEALSKAGECHAESTQTFPHPQIDFK